MRLRHLACVLTVAALSATATGQVCPKEKAVTVGHTVKFYGQRDCGSLKLDIPGISLGNTDQGCPRFVIVEPPHEVAAPSELETMIRVTGQTPTQILFFKCESDWLLFIRLSSTCVFDRQVAGGALQRMVTEGCIVPPTGTAQSTQTGR